jgi:DNA-binding NarL/FixJ family response regulator
MNRFRATAVLCVAFVVAPTAFACGEGHFNMGQGMRYQGYLAPRPATVLVYDQDPMQRKSIYQGLNRAGHHLTVARTTDDLAQALRSRHFDVVISDLGDSGTIDAGAARLLPVVQRQQRNEAGIRSRFRVFLLDGASLGQYLKGIDQVVRGALK